MTPLVDLEERIRKEWLDNISNLRQLPNGHWIGVSRFCFTFGLCVCLEDWMSLGYRYCYQNPSDAVLASSIWDGLGDAPGPWIKCKGQGRNDHNPLLYDHRGGSYWVPKPPGEIDIAKVWARHI